MVVSPVLNFNSIENEGAIAISEGLKTNTTLEELRLFKCGIGPAGGKAIGEALQLGISALKSLSLADNQLCGINHRGEGTYDPSGIQAIAAALTGSSALKSIDLSSNDLTAWRGDDMSGIQALADALKSGSAALTSLDLDGNAIGVEGAKALQSGTSALTSLDLQFNRLGVEGAKVVVAEELTQICSAMVGYNQPVTVEEWPDWRFPISHAPVAAGGVADTFYVDVLREQCTYVVERRLLMRLQSKRGAQWSTSGKKGGSTEDKVDDSGRRRDSSPEAKVARAIKIYKLPYLHGTIKTHRDPYGWRFIAGGTDVALNLIADWLHRCLSAMVHEVDAMAREVLLGLSADVLDAVPCESSFIIKDSRDVVTRIKRLEARRRALWDRARQGMGPPPKRAEDVEFGVHDFTTLYPTLDHGEIKEALHAVTQEVFERRAAKIDNAPPVYLGVASDMQPFKWSGEQRNRAGLLQRPPDSGKFKWFTCAEIRRDYEFLLDHCYAVVGDEILQQVRGVPMGLSCSPMIAMLMLAYLEIRQLRRMRTQAERPDGHAIESPWGSFTLSAQSRREYVDFAMRFSRSARAIDDLLLMEMSAAEQTWIIGQTYPASLELKMVCQSPQRIQFLDMEIKHDRGGFHLVLFDKRDELRLEGKMGVVRRFPHPSAVLAEQCKYACLTTFMHRANRVCMRRKSFAQHVAARTVEMMEDGYDARKLGFMMAKFVRPYEVHWRRSQMVARLRSAVKRLQMQKCVEPQWAARAEAEDGSKDVRRDWVADSKCSSQRAVDSGRQAPARDVTVAARMVRQALTAVVRSPHATTSVFVVPEQARVQVQVPTRPTTPVFMPQVDLQGLCTWLDTWGWLVQLSDAADV